jgi:hypothetical protein
MHKTFASRSLSPERVLGFAHLSKGIGIRVSGYDTYILPDLFANITTEEWVRSLLYTQLTWHGWLTSFAGRKDIGDSSH